MLRSLIFQLITQVTRAPKIIELLFQLCNRGDNIAREPTSEELRGAFIDILKQAQNVYICFDGIDETMHLLDDAFERQETLRFFDALLEVLPDTAHILITSRHERNLEQVLALYGPIIIECSRQNVDEDIKSQISRYISHI